MIKCIIVDDEPLASQLLASYASKIEELEVIATFSNPLDVIGFIQKNKVDLVFLDIQMPELSGVQLAQLLDKKTFVIFTTAYADHAVKGFELKAVDYLVKPISLQRFLESVNRVVELVANNSKSNENIKSKMNHIFVKTEYRLQKIDLKDIFYLKGMGDYVFVATSKGNFMTLENLKSFEVKLPTEQFIRVHKSYLIAFEKIDFVEKNRIKINEELIPIGRTYLDRFWKNLDNG